MPCLIIKTNLSLTGQQKENFAQSASAETAKILSKPETYVMTQIEDNITMTMSGTLEPAVYMELKSINLPEDSTTELSAKLCQHISQLMEINSSRIYIEFSNAQRHLWGWDNRTF
jgi:phenylpyruvate tautomerase PptA (4-oxalocrotonate tautomerase family)